MVVRATTYAIKLIWISDKVGDIRAYIWVVFSELRINRVINRLTNLGSDIKLLSLPTHQTYRARVVKIIREGTVDALITVKIWSTVRTFGKSRYYCWGCSYIIVGCRIWIFDYCFSTTGITLMNIWIQAASWGAWCTFVSCYIVKNGTRNANVIGVNVRSLRWA